MEPTHHHNLKSFTQFSISYQFLKKTTQILVSVSAFSILLLNSSPLISFLRSFNFSLSACTFLVQLFTLAIDKNCLFLLCNGILVFVAKFSGLVDSSSSSTTVKNAYDELYEAPVPLVLESKLTLIGEEETAEIVVSDQEMDAETDDEGAYLNLEDGRNQEKESGLLVIGQDGGENDEVFVEEDDKEDVNGELSVLDDQEEEEEEEEGMLSNEELNKKFEEFIRKIKEEIRVEAQQQLVMVN